MTWPLPPPEGLSERGWHALTTLVASLPLFAVEALPDGIVALLLVAVWVIGGVTTPRIALGGFATPQWALVVSTLAVGVAIAASGLLYRMALWVVANSRGGYAGQVIGLGVAGMVVGPAAPNATSRVALVAPAVTELVDALGTPAVQPAAIGLSMAVLIGFGQVVALFLTSSTTSVLVYAVLPEATRDSVNWGSWVARALPTHILLFVLLAALHPVALSPPRAQRREPGQRALPCSRRSLGHPRVTSGSPSVITVFLLVGFSTQPLHHVDPAWVGVVALAVLAATGVLAGERPRRGELELCAAVGHADQHVGRLQRHRPGHLAGGHRHHARRRAGELASAVRRGADAAVLRAEPGHALASRRAAADHLAGARSGWAPASTRG